MIPVPLFRGEFGLEVRFQVPVVYAMGDRARVEIEAGKEALYPLAERIIVERLPEDTLASSRERGRQGRPKVAGPEQRFVPDPFVVQDVPPADVVVCPRKRLYGASKNWDSWPDLTAMLHRRGYTTFAGGVRDSSYDVPGLAAWDYDRPLDATIQAMRAAKLVVATDAGLAHLAVLCGAPLLLVTYRGLVAPGPVIDSSGKVARPSFWQVRWGEYYRAANHTGAWMSKCGFWEYPERVVELVDEYMLTEASA